MVYSYFHQLVHTGVMMMFYRVSMITALLLLLSGACSGAERGVSQVVETPYSEQQVVYDFYFDDPGKMASALYWIRSLMNPLMAEPYNMAPEFLNIVVVIHGTEIVTAARKNYDRYKDVVERMRYYASLGVTFKVCGIAAHDYGYSTGDFYEFIDVVPSAITELAHWQLQGYALITPQVLEKRHAIEDIR